MPREIRYYLDLLRPGAPEPRRGPAGNGLLDHEKAIYLRLYGILGRGMGEELSEHGSQRTRGAAEDKTRVRPEPSGVANIAL